MLIRLLLSRLFSTRNVADPQIRQSLIHLLLNANFFEFRMSDILCACSLEFAITMPDLRFFMSRSSGLWHRVAWCCRRVTLPPSSRCHNPEDHDMNWHYEFQISHCLLSLLSIYHSFFLPSYKISVLCRIRNETSNPSWVGVLAWRHSSRTCWLKKKSLWKTWII